ncbi:MAG: DUF3667 domain-containing protein, partial [Bacteroidota bacterium]
MICKNCGADFHGKYCPECGQAAKTDRISGRYLLSELSEGIVQIDRGFLHTIKALTLQPGHRIRHFLAGKRVHFYKPIGFLLITSTIYVLTAYFLDKNTFFYDMALGFEEGASGANDSEESPETPLLTWLSN